MPGKKRREKTWTEKLLDVCAALVEDVFRDRCGLYFAKIHLANGSNGYARPVSIPLDSSQFRALLRLSAVQTYGSAPTSSEPYKAIVELLKARADFKPEEKTFVRVAAKDDTLFYDLGPRIVKIEPGKWTLEKRSPVNFLRWPGLFRIQVEPQEAEIDDFLSFKKFLPPNIKDRKRSELFLLAWIATAIFEPIAHPLLYFKGEAGGGKTLLADFVKQLVDPGLKAAFRENHPEDLAQILYKQWIAILDNCSFLSRILQDILCRAVTGESFLKRRLYTDFEDVIFEYRRCVIITTKEDLNLRSDTLDRTLEVNFERIEPEVRRDELDLVHEFQEELPSILGGLFATVSQALQILPQVKKEVNTGLPRLASFARVAEAISRVLGYPEFYFLEAYRTHLQEIASESYELINVIKEYCEMNQKPLAGEPTTVYAQLYDFLAQKGLDDVEIKVILGANSAVFSKKLSAISPLLKESGLIVIRKKQKGKRIIIIEKPKSKSESDSKSELTAVSTDNSKESKEENKESRPRNVSEEATSDSLQVEESTFCPNCCDIFEGPKCPRCGYEAKIAKIGGSRNE